MPHAHAARPRIRQARPSSGTSALLVGRELRRALRHERVALADEALALLAHRDDDLAALAERVGHSAGVADGHRGGPGPVADPEGEDVALVADRARGDLPRELVGATRLGRRRQLA